ncbi:MAG: DUF6702 family protein [Brumimicrobium sp.]|nr:DUF6702 family protein [Brumimicrobium sp.]
MLKRLLFICLLPFIFMNFHEYFFSFGEMQYNKETQRFEVSIQVTGHDLEEYMASKGIEIPSFEECVGVPLELKKIEPVLQQGFSISADGKELMLDLIGMEINERDEAVFFLMSRKITKPSSFTVKYDLLMDFYANQQNKLTIYTSQGKEYLTFLKNRSVRTFEYK